MWRTLGKATLAALGMTVAAGLAFYGLGRLGMGDGTLRRLLAVVVPGLAGVASYFILAARLNISEVRLAAALVRNRIGL